MTDDKPVAYILRDKHTGLFIANCVCDTYEQATNHKRWLEDSDDCLEIVPLVPFESETEQDDTAINITIEPPCSHCQSTGTVSSCGIKNCHGHREVPCHMCRGSP